MKSYLKEHSDFQNILKYQLTQKQSGNRKSKFDWLDCESRTQILRFFWSIISKNNIKTFENSKIGVFINEIKPIKF